MPLRSYTCTECGITTQHFQGLRDSSNPPCSCGKPTFRDYAAESDPSRRPTGMFEKPIEMYSVGMAPDEVSAFRQALPHVEIQDGVPLARTRQEKKAILAYFNFQEN